MKKISLALLPFLLAACSSPVEETELSVDSNEQVNAAQETNIVTNDYFSVEVPTTWVVEELPVKDGPQEYIFQSAPEYPEGYSCSTDFAYVSIMPYMYLESEDASEFDSIAKSTETYDEAGSLGKLGGSMEESTLGGKTAYFYENSGKEMACGQGAYLVHDGDYIFEVVLAAQEGGEQEKAMEALLDSLEF